MTKCILLRSSGHCVAALTNSSARFKAHFKCPLSASASHPGRPRPPFPRAFGRLGAHVHFALDLPLVCELPGHRDTIVFKEAQWTRQLKDL